MLTTVQSPMPQMQVGSQPMVPEDRFPYKSFRVCGLLQLIAGIVSVFIQLVDVIYASSKREEFLSDLDRVPLPTRSPYSLWCNYVQGYGCSDWLTHQKYISYNPSLASTGIWTGLMFLVAGIIGLCMTRERKDKRKCLKTAFWVLSLLNAIIFAPALFVATCAELAMVASVRNGWQMALILFFASIFEFVVSIVAASVCCCGSQETSPPPHATIITTTTYPSTVVQGYAAPTPGSMVVTTIPNTGMPHYQHQAPQQAPGIPYYQPQAPHQAPMQGPPGYSQPPLPTNPNFPPPSYTMQ